MNAHASDVVIIGAGPYGLSSAVHLRRAGLDVRVFGDPMSFWRRMPEGMFLRSNWSATNIAEPVGELSLDSYQADTGATFGLPVPLADFVDYGLWVQRRAVPDVDRRIVQRVDLDRRRLSIELEDGERLQARRVVVACGISRFAWRPPEFRDLPAELTSHTNDHRDLSAFAGKRVAVVGGGQSALESAVLMSERGAEVDVYIRRPDPVWLKGWSVKSKLGPMGPVVYAPTDVGPLWYSRLVATPDLFRRLPRRVQTPIARRSIRPAGSHWVRTRMDGVRLHPGRRVMAAESAGGRLALTLDDGTRTTTDHLLLGTGYRVDVERYPFLSSRILGLLDRHAGYPVLRRGLESSVPGLHFAGAPSAWSFGPLTRFVSGSWYCGRAIAREIATPQSVHA